MQKKYKEHDIITGVVTGLSPYGVFLLFDNDYTGLIHISELSDNYVANIEDFAKVSDSVTCEILSIDEEKKQLRCSIKNTWYGKEKEKNIDHGFTLLKKQLPIWVSDKLEEYQKNDKNANF